jgi:5-methylcytosine-specific restriction protein B
VETTERLTIWNDFLEEWPIERVEKLTLEQYIDVGSHDTFAYWLEHKTKNLGSIRGGDASKFGIYRRNKDPEGERSHIQHGDIYSWNNKFGSTATAAFESVKTSLLNVIKFVTLGDLTSIQDLPLADTLKWKVAFLYQDQQKPVIVNIFKRSMLQKLCNNSKDDFAALYEELMSGRGSKNIVQYGYELWRSGSLNDDSTDDNEVPSPKKIIKLKTNSLNRILYGPPGTGKTYNTINEALAIVDPAYLTEYEHDRHKIKARFDELVTKNRIGFVTFHQSFSYEDFVEGLKANSDNGVLSYSVDPGVFKSICERASSSHLQVVSVDAFDDAVIQLQEKYEEADDRIEMETVRGKKFEIEYIGGATFKIFPHSTESTDPKYVASIANVRKLYLTGSKQDIYNTSYVEGFLLYLKKHFGLKEYVPEVADHETTQQPFVLIIDEINRGNISNIFGELITLIEPSKRSGGAEALSVKLPYSKESFSVPSNLHIIGTMNTADKSLAQVDIALRRRFEFVEMMPKHELLEGIAIDGIDTAKMLKTINQRIELLYDREHTIGHSFFLPLKDDPSIERLARIFELEILPLLEEYFFEDWERVGQVLGDHLKTDASLQFIEEKFTDSSVLQLMGNDWSQDGIRPYQRNDAALRNPDAYKGIYDAQQG